MLKKCRFCGKEFKVYKSTFDKKVYCFLECNKKDTTALLSCRFCGKEYSVPNSLIKEKRIRIYYCSNECYKKYKNIKYKNDYYHKCTNCGGVFL